MISLSSVELSLDIAIVVSALLSSVSGLIAMGAFKEMKYAWADIFRARLDVLLFLYVCGTTSLSIYHTAMMVDWALKPGIEATGLQFLVLIDVWNIACSVLLGFSHLLAVVCAKYFALRPGNNIYLRPRDE